MKCILLAGGRGDRMWPLSRKNHPKQFIQIKNNHSIFQETIARNMAFCDEFIIVTNSEYQFIVENQMKAFRGLVYSCIYEETGKNTAPALVLASMHLPESELILVAPCDQLISGDGYKDTIMEARRLAKNGEFVKLNDSFYVFQKGALFNHIENENNILLEACVNAYQNKSIIGNNIYYSKDALENVPSIVIDDIVKNTIDLENAFKVENIGGLDDLVNQDISKAMDDRDDVNRVPAQVISNKCDNTTVINKSDKKLVLVNHLNNILVVNTDDAIYIGEKGQSNDLKEIILQSKNMWNYFNKSSLFYKKWGYYEVLSEDIPNRMQVRKVTVLPSKTIYFHKHERKIENLVIITGRAYIYIGDETRNIGPGDSVNISAQLEHQISCISDVPLVFVETATNVEYEKSEDTIAMESKDVAALSLGYDIEPFVLLTPAYKDYIWGGNKLKEVFNKNCEFDTIAESWELSAHPDGQCSIACGESKGKLFLQYLKDIGDEALGWKYQGGRDFPLMIKLIDAKENLSIQVHPNDEYALEHENEYGKSELWYVYDCEPDSFLYCGFNRDVTREEVSAAINNNTIESLLNKISVKKGGMYYIPAGTIHAIGKGCLICEIQQNSNSTYRVYDYNRKDKYGRKRRLDIDKALDVLDYSEYKESGECKYFNVECLECDRGGYIQMSKESFCALMILEGDGSISYLDNELAFSAGNCVFIPGSDLKLELKGRFKYIDVRI